MPPERISSPDSWVGERDDWNAKALLPTCRLLRSTGGRGRNPALIALIGMTIATALFRLLLTAPLLGGALRATQHFQSGLQRVDLLELYTSEGCSSCPPAEKWFGELQHDPGLWREFVPVAFHVNYWDRLGWRDILASKPFTDRQYAYAATWKTASVYTPCFVRNGAEWRPREQPLNAKIRHRAEGELTLSWDSARNTCAVTYSPATPLKVDQAPVVSVALLGGDVVSKVVRGENSGRTLRHDFVALQMKVVPLQRAGEGAWSASMVLSPRTDVRAARLALAGWITADGEIGAVQAAGGWIEPR